MYTVGGFVMADPNYLAHYGTKGMKWGVRRYQNPDGSLTEAGKKRYNVQSTMDELYKRRNDYDGTIAAYNKRKDFTEKQREAYSKENRNLEERIYNRQHSRFNSVEDEDDLWSEKDYNESMAKDLSKKKIKTKKIKEEIKRYQDKAKELEKVFEDAYDASITEVYAHIDSIADEAVKDMLKYDLANWIWY